MKKSVYAFTPHQAYLEKNTVYYSYKPAPTDPLYGLVFEVYQVDSFDIQKTLAFPDICADIIAFYTENDCYSYVVTSTDIARSMENDFGFMNKVKSIFGIKLCTGAAGNLFNCRIRDIDSSATPADIALVNGGGIRDSIAAGDVTRKDLMDVNPWNNEMCAIRATGQQILDALEHGARLNPEENGGFLQVSGLTYEIHNYIESPVVTDSMEMFQSVDSTKERRVQNVMIGGKAIDPEATYTVAGSFYTLQEQGDGFTMFEGAEVLEHENLPVDSEMLIKYFTEELGGVISADMYGNPLGDGRITVLTQEKQETPDSDEDLTPSPTPGGDDNDGQQGGSDQDQNAGQKPGQNGNAGGSNTGTNGGKGGSVNTGDPSDMYGLFAVMAVAAGAAGCAIYYIQRQRKHGDN